MMDKGELKRNLEQVWSRIERAKDRAGRKDDILLVAVSKTKPAELIQMALELGQYDFGENYAQELRDKSRQIADPKIRWHFIGTLQRNKVKYLIGKVVLIHSVDSPALLEEIEKRAEKAGVVMSVLLEVKLSPEESKAGVEVEQLSRLAETALKKPHIELQGLMTMPPYFPDPQQARPYYLHLRELRDKLEGELGIKLPQLSMGMSNDFEVAIEEGATIIRVGTAIFGEREQCRVSAGN